MSFADNIVVIPSHNDVFGARTKSVEIIIREMSQYSSYAIIHVCTKLMLLLNSAEGTSPKAQGSVAGELLDAPSRERLLVFLREKAGSRPQFFHHVPVLMLLKINLENNDTSGRGIETKVDKTLLASWLISLSDLWLPDIRASKRGWPYFYENLRVNQSRQFLQEGHDEIINLLARGSHLLGQVSRVKSLRFNDLFEQSTGISVELYTEMLFLTMVQWSVRLEGAVIDKIAVRSIDNFFSTSNFTKPEVKAFMKIISFQAEDYKALKTDAMERIKIKDSLQNFIVFIDKPILTYGDNFICLSPSFLALKLTEGPYRIVEAALKGMKNENQLSEEWGKAYEIYVNERLAKTFHNTRPNPATKNSELDNLAVSGAYGLMVESKFAHWTFAARVSGSRDDMKKYIGKIARFKDWRPKPGEPLSHKKLGLGQIKQFYLDICKDLGEYELEGRTIIPILVLGEGFPFDPGNRKYLEDFAIEQQCLIKDKSVLPFITINSDELELIESFSEEFGEAFTTGLIVEHARSLDMGITRKSPVHLRPTSLFNHFHATGKRSKNNKFLRKELDDLTARVMKHRRTKGTKSSSTT